MRRICAVLIAVVAGAGLSGCGGNSSVQGALPGLGVSQTSVSFGANFGLPFDPAPVDVDVTNSGGGTLTFTATSDSPWLMVTPGNGTAPESIGITATLGTLAVGTYTGHVTVTAAGAQGSPATITVTLAVASPPSNTPFWAQWGANPQHTGMVSVNGQSPASQLADIVYDPFVTMEQAENAGAGGDGDLTVHYPAPITDGNDVYFMTKTGTYTPCKPAGAWANGAACGPNTWSTEVWNAVRYSWITAR
jgi:Viral BACON domain